MIKIITGHSAVGGSTTALIDLTNQLNNHGYDATMYGANQYHLDKCKGALIQKLSIEEEDLIIAHFVSMGEVVKNRKGLVVLVSHEQDVFKIKSLPKFYNKIIFVNEKQRAFHKYNGNYDIIPLFKPELPICYKEENKKVAAVIGSIDENKQTDISIMRALNEDYDKVFVFGSITSRAYYEKCVHRLIDGDKVIYKGVEEDKVKMYSQVGAVFHSALKEVHCLVKDECEISGIPFYGTESTNRPLTTLSNEDIFKLWERALLLKK